MAGASLPAPAVHSSVYRGKGTRLVGVTQRRQATTIGHCGCCGQREQCRRYQDETDQRLFHGAPLLVLRTCKEAYLGEISFQLGMAHFQVLPKSVSAFFQSSTAGRGRSKMSGYKKFETGIDKKAGRPSTLKDTMASHYFIGPRKGRIYF